MVMVDVDYFWIGGGCCCCCYCARLLRFVVVTVVVVLEKPRGAKRGLSYSCRWQEDGLLWLGYDFDFRISGTRNGCSFIWNTQKQQG